MTIKAALEALTIPFAHYSWQGTPPAPYGTWGEDGAAETVFAEGAHQERADSVSVDLFTRDDTGADAAAVEQALSGVTACAWELEAVQYEHPTGLVHYTCLILRHGRGKGVSNHAGNGPKSGRNS